MTKTIEVDAEVIDAVSAEVTKAVEADFKAKSDELDARIEKFQKELEENKEKEIEKSKLESEAEEIPKELKKFAELSKEQFVVEQINAQVNKDIGRLAELNKYALKTQFDAGLIDKATYHNAGIVADGGALVPSNDLLTDVFTTLGTSGSIASDLRTVTLTSGNGIDVATLLQDVVISEVGTEGGNKPVTKAVFGDGEVNVREFSGIAIITKKLLRQAAVDVYGIIRDSFARAIANKRAALALTDASSGIVNKAGVVQYNASAATVSGYTWKDVKKAPYQVTATAAQGGKYYISRQLLEVLDTAEDSQNRDLDIIKSLNSATGTGTFKNGYEFSVEDVLGTGGQPHLVFGNAARYGILVRQSTVEFKLLEEATVVDGNSVAHNLGQQNKVAPRFEFHENVGYPIPSAFVKLMPSGTTTTTTTTTV